MAVVGLFDAVLKVGKTLQKAGNEWYDVSGKMDIFCMNLDHLSNAQQVWKENIRTFGLTNDQKLREIFITLESHLNRAKDKLVGKDDDYCHCQCISKYKRKIKFWILPSALESTIQSMDSALVNFSKELTGEEKLPTEIEAIEKVLCKWVQLGPSRYSFSPDSSYIPLRKTEKEVKEALRDPKGASVCLLYGPFGTGKSAMARNPALDFQAELDKGPQRSTCTTDAPSESGKCALARNLARYFRAEINEGPQRSTSTTDAPASSTDGVMFEKVVHLECGPEVNLKKKQNELVDQLVRTYKARDTEITKLLAALLRERALLIIMDDVWDNTFLQEMVRHGGEHVKWLVLSHTENCCNGLKSISKHRAICMEKVDSQNARRILAALTGWPQDWEKIQKWKDAMNLLAVPMDSIIRQTDANPLALTCIASNIDPAKKTDREHWNEVVDELSKALGTELTTGAHGVTGNRSHRGAIKMCFERLSNSQKYVLILNCLCKGPSVPFDVIKYIYKQTTSPTSDTFVHASNELRAKQLITETTWATGWGKKISWFFHDLWRAFITEDHLRPTQSADHVVIIESLSKRNNCILFDNGPQKIPHEGPVSKLHVLISMMFLYFHEDFRPKVADKLAIFQEASSSTINKRKEVITPVVSLLVRPCDKQWTTSVLSSALEVFFKYATDGIFEDIHTSNLLKSPISQVSMLEALYNSVWIAVSTREHPPVMGELVFNALFEMLEAQMAVLRGDPPKAPFCGIEFLHCVATVFGKSFDHNVKQITTYLEKRFQRVLDDLIPGLLKFDELNVGALGNLALGSDSIKDLMVSRLELLQNMVTALKRDDLPNFQERVADLVDYLSSDRTNSIMVGFPGLLPALVAGLDESKNQGLQESSADALASLADNDDDDDGDIEMRMTKVDGLLEKLVAAMGRNDSPAFQARAADVVCNLLSKRNRTRLTLLDFPGLLPALVAGLDVSENQKLQMTSAQALCLVAKNSDGARKLMDNFPDGDTEMRMTKVNGLLEKLVAAMERNDFPAFQARAAHVVCNLLSSRNRTRSTLLDFPGLLPAMVAGLDKSENQELQMTSAQALFLVAQNSDDARKLMDNFPEILDTLVDKVTNGDNSDFNIVAIQMFTLTVLSPERAKEMSLCTARAYLGRATGEAWWGHYKESIEDYNRYDKLVCETEDPDSRQTLSLRCSAKAKLGDLEGALADANVLVGINCRDPSPLRQRGVVKRMMEDYSGALADFDASLCLCIENDKSYYRVLKHRGFVKFLSGDEDGARADARRALTCSKPSRADDEGFGRLFVGRESLRYLEFELI